MATAKPVIASSHGGPTELVLDGETGALVPPGDARALARAMEQFIDDPGRARRLGEEGRRRAVARYDVAQYVERVQRVYDDILSEPVTS